jgi:hypothetical protein
MRWLSDLLRVFADHKKKPVYYCSASCKGMSTPHNERLHGMKAEVKIDYGLEE